MARLFCPKPLWRTARLPDAEVLAVEILQDEATSWGSPRKCTRRRPRSRTGGGRERCARASPAGADGFARRAGQRDIEPHMVVRHARNHRATLAPPQFHQSVSRHRLQRP